MSGECGCDLIGEYAGVTLDEQDCQFAKLKALNAELVKALEECATKCRCGGKGEWLDGCGFSCTDGDCAPHGEGLTPCTYVACVRARAVLAKARGTT